MSPPCPRFPEGLTAAGLGPPVLEKALEQHDRYCAALEGCGVELVHVPSDPLFPDGTFVEDTAVLGPGFAVICRPGAESRRGETAPMRTVLAPFHSRLYEIEAPGTLDGGDVCRAGDSYYIGVSGRTNREGARELAGFLEREGFHSSFVDIGGAAGLLHLKSGMSYLGDGRLFLVDGLAAHRAFARRGIVRVPRGEEYAANCVRVNDAVLVAAGFPRARAALAEAGLDVVELDMSEFRKMDGGLSCLSLRF